MAKERSKTPENENGAPSKRQHKSKSKRKNESESETESESEPEGDVRKHRRKRSRSRSQSRSGSSRRKSRDDYTDSDSGSSSEYSETESEEERRRRKRRERKRREEQRKLRKDKEKKRRKKEKEKKERKKKKKEKGKTGAVTNSWGKYGIIKETDMWNKRPEFTAWLAEIKKMNLESLPNWEEKQLFKQFMEDHNTATFPSKKYYNLDAYYKRKMEKEMKRGVKKVVDNERTVFNDEEIRRQELMREREKHKEEQVEALKREMQSGMAQAMKEQAQLREEMAYQYKLGNFEAAAAIQRRLDPDLPM
ncbi:vicilin-like seed storage protein At2g18540 [Lycium barbarum]|uniref:vicilin-like seed storage protein At2g18540 n=2 Tax=Lycium TaxID=24646 RepID=UPI00293E4320|nr:vicilin-like seed storage protein At2g18540 [Lycium barbarum]